MGETTAIRGPALTYTGDAFREGLAATMRYESDAIVAMKDGKITHFGPASQVRDALPPDTTVKDLGKDTLTMAGFIDCHVHYPQTQIIGAYGEQLLDWLEKYTFVIASPTPWIPPRSPLSMRVTASIDTSVTSPNSSSAHRRPSSLCGVTGSLEIRFTAARLVRRQNRTARGRSGERTSSSATGSGSNSAPCRRT